MVIDPGHGGAKPGAQGGRTQEKHITLAIAKKFGKLISDNYPDVKVIYTRTTDVDISLAERAHIANRNKADLFISIHANSHPTAAPTGVETFVMGLSESRANLEVAKKENADILLEADYKSNDAYKGFDPNAPESFVMLAMFQNSFIDKSLNLAQAIQNQYKQNLKTINRGVKQAELFVLYKTTCPSVLTEVGFISNPSEEAFMISDEGQAKIAISLFNAFMTFKATEEGTNK
ncbi:MAG: N-acetylmuramoyl-L-alanine amidase, partial [Prevotella sp.]|nr:N-acetylmuramoyl-L-alanine amidase [Prevotella sp.]